MRKVLERFEMTLLPGRPVTKATSQMDEDYCTTSEPALSVKREENNNQDKKRVLSLSKTMSRRQCKQEVSRQTITEIGAKSPAEDAVSPIKLVNIQSLLKRLLWSCNEPSVANRPHMCSSFIGRALASNTAYTAELLFSVSSEKHSTARENEEHMAEACHAAITGNTDLLRRLLEKDMQLVTRRWRGLTLIHLAAFGGHIDTVTALIAAGAVVNSTMEQSDRQYVSPEDHQMKGLDTAFDLRFVISEGCVSPLMLAAAEGHLRVVELLIDNGADCDAVANEGQNVISPLFYAVEKGCVELVHLLVNRGARVDLQEGWERQSLLHVVRDSRLARLLIDCGLNVGTLDKNSSTPLHCAAARHDIEIASQFLEHAADINAEDIYGETPLYHALNGRCTTELIQFLISRGSRIKHRTKVDNRTPLHESIVSVSCSYDVIQLLIDSGSDINAKDSSGRTPLHLASAVSENFSYDVVKLLLDKGANVKAVDILGQVPLHCAAAQGDLDTVRALLDSGSDVNVATALGVLPIHFAARAGCTPIMQLLVERKSEVNRLVAEWNEPEIDSSQPRMLSALTIVTGQRNLEAMKLLLEHRADADLRDEHGATALHVATRMGCIPAINILLQHGADTSIIGGSYKTTAIHLAAKLELAETLKLLVQYGGDVNAIDQDGATPLHCAAKAGCAKNVKFLLENGANVKAFTDSNWSTALHIAATLRSPKILKLLLDYGADVHVADGNDRTPLDVAVKCGRDQNTTVLLQRSNKTGARKDLSRAASLHSAAEMKCSRTLKLLIEEGLDVNSVNSEGKTALHCAASNGREENVRILLAHGSWVNAVTTYSRSTPLHFIARKNCPRTLQSMIDRGADISAIDDEGNTPLHCAVDSGPVVNVRMLIENGSNLGCKNKLGLTPLDLAVSRDRRRIEDEILLRQRRHSWIRISVDKLQHIIRDHNC